jgi:hypothetical protein
MRFTAFALLILTLAPLTHAQSNPATRPASPATPSSTAPGGESGADMKFMSADQVFNQMLKPATRPTRQLAPVSEQPVHDAKSATGSIKPNAPAVIVIREGTMIIDRLGRLSHTDTGQPEFTFEADGKALRDPPMLLLPNLTLNQIEDTINAWNRDAKLRVTGVVTEYKGRNYLLLEKVIVPLDVAQQF